MKESLLTDRKKIDGVWKYLDGEGNYTRSRPRVLLVPVERPEGVARTRAKQEFATEVNINYIRKRMLKGIVPPGFDPNRAMTFRDTTSDLSFMDAFDVVQKGREAFETLPIGLRRELDHDPRNIGSATRDQFERYGLLKAKEDTTAGTPGVRSTAASEGGSGGESPPSKAPPGATSGSPAVDGKK